MTRHRLRLLTHCVAPLLLGVALAAPAIAQVFKCTNGARKTTYQSQPCPAATRSAKFGVASAAALIAVQQPAGFRAYCECFADTVLAEPDKLKELGQRNDRAGVERLMLRAGTTCASRLKLE